jgi:hypothetical protein
VRYTNDIPFRPWCIDKSVLARSIDNLYYHVVTFFAEFQSHGGKRDTHQPYHVQSYSGIDNINRDVTASESLAPQNLRTGSERNCAEVSPLAAAAEVPKYSWVL